MKACTSEWAWVPRGSIPITVESPTFDEKAAPPIRAARPAALAPKWADRRSPNSKTGCPLDASASRDALVAMRVWKLRWLSSEDSRICAMTSGPSIITTGVFAWTTRPSGTARSEMPSKLPFARSQRRKSSSNTRWPAGVRWAAEHRDLLVAESCGCHPVEQPVHACSDAVSGLVAAVVRVATKEVLEQRRTFVEVTAEVRL